VSRSLYDLDPINLATLQALCGLINRHSGLAYNESSRSLLERRLGVRVLERGLTSFVDYVELLAEDDEELGIVFEILTTKETYFFRQEYQLRTFVDEVMPILVQESEGRGRLTIWSAGCSSGEETYTLAMMLSDHPLLHSFKVRLIGTDLCASNVEAAERGIYRESSMRSTSPEDVEKYFLKVPQGYQVKPELRRMVHFSCGNLVYPADVRSVGRVDVIFCRNVLIYFDQRTRQATTNLFYERLLPGGFLLLGHSESLLNSETRFEPVHLVGDLVYRRPLLERNPSPRTRSAK
jgi:chemotaxis protein methyltransferase CheR